MMEPYYARDGIQIFLGDCREVLPTLAPASVDVVLTDPPYGVAYSTGYRSGVVRSSTRLVGDLLTAPLLNDTAAFTAPLLNDTAAIYWFAAPLELDRVLPVLRRWEVVNVLAWDKGNCSAGDLYTRWGEQWEAIIYARQGRPLLRGGRLRDVVRFSRGDTSAYQHPTQKPVALLRFLLDRHEVGLMLDPFCGAGSSLRAALDLGWTAVGIEAVEAYCEVAARRLEQLPMALEATP